MRRGIRHSLYPACDRATGRFPFAIMRRRDDLAQFLPQRRNVSGTIYFPEWNQSIPAIALSSANLDLTEGRQYGPRGFRGVRDVFFHHLRPLFGCRQQWRTAHATTDRRMRDNPAHRALTMLRFPQDLGVSTAGCPN